MIKIFRKIRQQLLSENKFSKYFLYAIGETFLVVVGILIALQLNNWNEDRKSKIAEIEIYKEIKDDIIVSLEDLEEGRVLQIRKIAQHAYLVDHLKNQLPNNDSIPRILLGIANDDQFFPKTSGFEALKSIGLEILRNDTLRQKITNLYQLSFVRVVNRGLDGSTARNLRFLEPYEKLLTLDYTKSRHLNYTDNDSVPVHGEKIRNYEHLLKDAYLPWDLNEAIWKRRGKLVNYRACIRWSNELLLEIDEELERLQN